MQKLKEENSVETQLRINGVSRHLVSIDTTTCLVAVLLIVICFSFSKMLNENSAKVDICKQTALDQSARRLENFQECLNKL